MKIDSTKKLFLTILGLIVGYQLVELLDYIKALLG